VRGSITLNSITKGFELYPSGLDGDGPSRRPGVLAHTVDEIEFGGLLGGAESLSGAFGAVAPEVDVGDLDGLTVVVRAEFWIEGATFVMAPEPSGRLLHVCVLVVLGLLAKCRQNRSQRGSYALNSLPWQLAGCSDPLSTVAVP
jgi:hypothetical protein